jgi:WD40 repeat protein
MKNMASGGDGVNDGEKYLLASSGADGIVRLWSACCSSGEEKELNWQCVGMQDHHLLERDGGGGASEEEEERPQVYALQFVQSKAVGKNTNILLTSANDTIYLWNIDKEDDVHPQSPNNDDAVKRRRKFIPLRSIRFSHVDDEGSNFFGGLRNPNNELYVFDASYCESTDLLGVALSDGTCRVLSPLASTGRSNYDDSYRHDQCVLSLPPGYFAGKRGGHLTALSWDKSGTRLATCIASGRVVLWLLQVAIGDDGAQVLHPSCVSVLEGGKSWWLVFL